MTVQTYGAAPLRLRMAFRFRRAADGRPFAILDPSVWEFNVPEETFLRLYVAVKRGACTACAGPSGKTWLDYYEGRREVPSLLPAAVDVAPSYATGEQVRVGDAVLSDGGLYPGRVVQLAPGARRPHGLRVQGRARPAPHRHVDAGARRHAVRLAQPGRPPAPPASRGSSSAGQAGRRAAGSIRTR